MVYVHSARAVRFLGFANAAFWSDNTLDLMNNPIVAPAQKPEGGVSYYKYGEGGVELPHKTWEAYVTGFCIIIAVSITFPLLIRILTAEAEKNDSSIEGVPAN